MCIALGISHMAPLQVPDKYFHEGPSMKSHDKQADLQAMLCNLLKHVETVQRACSDNKATMR